MAAVDLVLFKGREARAVAETAIISGTYMLQPPFTAHPPKGFISGTSIHPRNRQQVLL